MQRMMANDCDGDSRLEFDRAENVAVAILNAVIVRPVFPA